MNEGTLIKNFLELLNERKGGIMIPDTMTAIVKTERAPGGELITVKVPQINHNEVLVKVHATSICGTDAHIFEWNKWAQERIRNIPQIMGHEFSGEVVAIGDNVNKVKEGDIISAETHIPCGHCKQCLTGQQHICDNLSILGVDINGCFAEYAAIPESVVWKNDKSIPPHIGAVQEPLGNAIYCTLVEPVTGKSVVVFGDGPTGLLSVAVAKAAGASLVVLVGLDKYRMDIGENLGADMVLHGIDDNVEGRISKLTDGIGADVVLEMAGAEKSISLGLKVVRKGGRYCAFGLPASNVTIDYNNGIIFKGLTLYGINGRQMFDTWFKTRNLLSSGLLNIEPVITHHFPLTDFEKGFSLMLTQPRVAGKIVLYPDPSLIPDS